MNNVRLEGESETMCPNASVQQNATRRPEPEQQPVHHAINDMNDSRRAILTNNLVDVYCDLPEPDLRPQKPATTDAEMTPVTYANIIMFPDIFKVPLRRKLFISRLCQFCDKPETYFVWKSSLKSVLIDLHITDFEQLGLLVMCLNRNPAHIA